MGDGAELTNGSVPEHDYNSQADHACVLYVLRPGDLER